MDDRGEWPGVWGGQDISLILKAMHYAGAGRWRDAPWAVRYPSLPNVMSEHPAWPEFNEILWNDFSDRVGLALGGQSNHPTYPSNMTVATLQRYHSVFAENVLPAAGTHKPETRPGASEEPGQRARETQGKREAEKPPGDPSHCTCGVERRAEFGALGSLAGCFLAPGSGLGLVGTASSRR